MGRRVGTRALRIGYRSDYILKANLDVGIIEMT